MKILLTIFAFLFLIGCKSPTESKDKICGVVYTTDDWYFIYTTYIITNNKTYRVESSDTELMYELNKLQMVDVCLYYNSIDGNVITIYDYK